MTNETEKIINYIRKRKEAFKLDRELSNEMVKEYCKGIGVSVNGLVFVLASLYISEVNRYQEAYKAFNNEHEKNVVLQKTINELKKQYGLNGNQIQRAKVTSGLPIAKKSGTLSQLRQELEFGSSDEEIMKKYNISATTLWRWKKKLKESNL